MSKRRGFTGVIALLVATTVLVGCSSEDSATDASCASGATETRSENDQLYEAAKAEGKVVVYENASPEAVEALEKCFEAKYSGIDVEAVRLPDAEMIPRLETELSSGAPTADFIENASPGWLIEQGKEGAWVASDAPTASGEGDYDASKWFDEKTNVYQVGGTVNTFAWNTDLVPDGIEDYTDLLDPALADGKVGVLELASAPANDFYIWLERTFGASFNEELGAQQPRIYPSTTVIVEALSSGEIYASNWVLPNLVEDAKAAGAPIEYGQSPTGMFGLHGYGVINAKAEHPNAAKLYLEYLLSAEGQAILWELGATVLATKPDGVLAKMDELPPWNPAQSTPDKLEVGRTEWDAAYR